MLLRSTKLQPFIGPKVALKPIRLLNSSFCSIGAAFSQFKSASKGIISAIQLEYFELT